MDAPTARWLTSDAAASALAAAAAEPDPGSLGAAQRLRALVEPDQAAAVLAQAALCRKAVAKLGPRAETMFFTADGLEQATRWPVAARRAARLADHADAVADLGCGLGVDALALQEAGVGVTAVERDEVTAILASANLGQQVEVADVTDAWPQLAASDPTLGVFADPARRTGAGRSWRIEDLSPPWPFVASLLTGERVACVKLGPGVPHHVIPDDVEAEWVSDSGTVVECTLWAGPGATPGRRTAVVDGLELSVAGQANHDVGPIDDHLYEPDGAVVRAGLVDDFAATIGAHRIAPGIAYLTAPQAEHTPFATAFRISEVLPFDEKVLRAWVRDRGIGTLEIKKRGVDLDPAVLRRSLKPKGRNAATLVVTPTPEGARVLVCERVSRPGG